MTRWERVDNRKIERGLHYRFLFVAHNGPGPWKCGECGGLVHLHKRFDVDHIDGNHGNDDPSNLQALHPSCHWEKTAREQRERALRAIEQLEGPTQFLRDYFRVHRSAAVAEVIRAGLAAGYSDHQIRRARRYHLQNLLRAQRIDPHDRNSKWAWVWTEESAFDLDEYLRKVPLEDRL